MRKNGHTSAGRQRWRCDRCHATCTRSREDLRRRAEFDAFLDWLVGKRTASECAASLGLSRQWFARRISWCWHISPPVPNADRVPFVQVDGTWLPHDWCLLVCCDAHCQVLAWQWAGSENASAYRALLAHIRRVDAVCCDGAKGALGAIRVLWPKARVQRCLVHVQRDGRVDLTAHPRTPAGRDLRKLYLRLTRIHDTAEVAQWIVDLDKWHKQYKSFLKERTAAASDPTHPNARAGRTWWWTHLRVRRAYFRLEHLSQDGLLFAFLDPDNKAAASTTSTSNAIEGGVNAGLKRLLDLHRGLSEEHMRRCAEWYLYLHTSAPDPYQVLANYLATPVEHTTKPEPEPTDSDRFGTGIDWNEFHTSAPWQDNN